LVRRVITLGIMLVVLGLVHVALGLRVVQLGYDLSLARQMQLRLEHEQRELELELATRRDPARIAEAARRRLGMAEPRKGQVVYLP
jgi:cell division protein FtsL